MVMEGFRRDINEFEDLLQRIATDITSGVIFERLPPAEIWNRSESSVTSLRNLAERIMETMLLLKPEKTPITERGLKAVLSPLDAFKEVLFQETEDPVGNARRALEQLRKSVTEGSDFVRLAKDIESSPSELITEILRLREVYGAKDYLSAIPIPEAVHARFTVLEKRFETLRLHMSNLKKSLEEVRAHMDAIEKDIRKFEPSPTEKEEEQEKKEAQEEAKPASEPQLRREGEDS